MSKRKDTTRGNDREVMQARRRRGNETARDREIMEGSRGRGKGTAGGGREIMAPSRPHEQGDSN